MKSNHDFELILSREAYEDLVDIQNYSYSQYGEEQWSSYGALMEDALNLIVRQPSSGHTRKDIPNGYLAWNAGKHVIIYRIDEEVIYVIRILHQRMDFTYKFR